MPILSPKRQITLPKELCDRLLIEPGDDLVFLEHQGRITIIKRVKGSSDGVLKHITADKNYSDEESLRDAVEKRHVVQRGRKRAA